MRIATILLGLGLLTSASAADLSGVKTYLSGKLDTQLAGTRALSTAADGYYALAKGANFDYAALAKNPQTRAARRSGTAVGLALVIGVGVAVFKWQAKLPMKKLLIWTGVLIAAVLAVMVGNTVHTMQLVGWLPVHPLPLELPANLGLWLGLHGTWEGVLLQIGSVAAVIGSFLAAEALKTRELRQRQRGAAIHG